MKYEISLGGGGGGCFHFCFCLQGKKQMWIISNVIDHLNWDRSVRISASVKQKGDRRWWGDMKGGERSPSLLSCRNATAVFTSVFHQSARRSSGALCELPPSKWASRLGRPACIAVIRSLKIAPPQTQTRVHTYTNTSVLLRSVWVSWSKESGAGGFEDIFDYRRLGRASSTISIIPPSAISTTAINTLPRGPAAPPSSRERASYVLSVQWWVEKRAHCTPAELLHGNVLLGTSICDQKYTTE